MKLMSTRFVNIDRNTPFLLPPDLRDWVPENDLVHLVLEAVNLVPLEQFRFNARGSGSEQYPPSMMLALLIYCYANGIFSSRRIELATHRDVAVRYLTANTHPDHDTIATFRRENFDAVAWCFARVLEMAHELKLLKLGTVSIDGTKLRANASKQASVRYDRAGELLAQLELDVRELMKRAEQADQDPSGDPQRLPEDLAKREALKRKLEEARAQIEKRNRARVAAEEAAFERERARRKEAREAGLAPEPDAKKLRRPKKEVRQAEQSNLTDPDSRLMRKSHNSAYEQAYNPQLAVDADGSQLVVGARVSNQAFDYRELKADVNSIPRSIGQPTAVLADGSYSSQDEAEDVEERGIDVYISVTSEKRKRQRYDLRPEDTDPPPPNARAKSPYWQDMQGKMSTDTGKALYARRKQTVEPVFGIIKSVMGFTRFHLRGLSKVTGEWNLVATAYNIKRLHRLKTA
jgi:transposase